MRCQPNPEDSLPSRLFAPGDPRRLGLWVFPSPHRSRSAGELDEEALARHVAPICASADCVVAMGAIAEVDYLTDDEWKRCLAIAGGTVPPAKPAHRRASGRRRASGPAGRRHRSVTGGAVLVPLGDADPTGQVLTIADRSRRPVIPYLRRTRGRGAAAARSAHLDRCRRRPQGRPQGPALVSATPEPGSARYRSRRLGGRCARLLGVRRGRRVARLGHARPRLCAAVDRRARPRGPTRGSPAARSFRSSVQRPEAVTPGIDIACVKHALALRGHYTPVTRAPSTKLTAAEQLEIRRLLDAIDSLGPAPSQRGGVELTASGPNG